MSDGRVKSVSGQINAQATLLKIRPPINELLKQKHKYENQKEKKNEVTELS